MNMKINRKKLYANQHCNKKNLVSTSAIVTATSMSTSKHSKKFLNNNNLALQQLQLQTTVYSSSFVYAGKVNDFKLFKSEKLAFSNARG